VFGFTAAFIVLPIHGKAVFIVPLIHVMAKKNISAAVVETVSSTA